MREKYESLVLVQLRELAKVRGLKVTSSMKKADLVEAMLAEDERVKAQEAEESAKSQKTETAADGQEAQQAGESAPEPARKRNAVTNKRTAASQQKSTRSQSAVQNESNYKAENTVQRESAQKSEEAGAGQGAQASGRGEPYGQTAWRFVRLSDIPEEILGDSGCSAGDEHSGVPGDDGLFRQYLDGRHGE